VCGREAAGGRPVVIHVIAERATLDGTGTTPASELSADGLIPPELVQELAASAMLMPLIHPADTAPEEGYVPSTALADFVRCRDLTCRAPGCERPAIGCDIDTIAYADGGTTCASNLKCLCRLQHRLAEEPFNLRQTPVSLCCVAAGNVSTPELPSGYAGPTSLRSCASTASPGSGVTTETSASSRGSRCVIRWSTES
jgi:hypothetical protein